MLALPEISTARALLVCLSFGGELDTAPLIERLVARGCALFVPRADPRDGELHLHPWPCALETLSFGLRQPPRGTPELDARAIGGRLDAALVLGLAFDRRGFRLGHGRGYFDRFFARHGVLGVGLVLEAQLVERLPIEPHDRPMRCLVSEREVLRPRSAKTEERNGS